MLFTAKLISKMNMMIMKKIMKVGKFYNVQHDKQQANILIVITFHVQSISMNF